MIHTQDLFRMSLNELCERVKQHGVTDAKVTKGTVCVNIDGFWYGALDNNTEINQLVVDKALSYEAFLQLTTNNNELKDKHVLISAKERKYWVGDTEAEVLPFETDDSYCGLTGFNRKEAHDSIL